MMRAFFEKNDKILSGISSLGSALGVFLAVIGLFFTGCQIMKAKDQLEATRLYEIQKDGRDILRSISSDLKVANYIMHFDENRSYDPDTKMLGYFKIQEVLLFYLSVHKQIEKETLSEEAWNDLKQDFCGFAAKESVATYLKESVKNQKILEKLNNLKAGC